MREGIHPEKPALPFTPGWDLVGAVDRIGNGVSGIERGQMVAALPIKGSYGPQQDSLWWACRETTKRPTPSAAT
jgi:NADPH:quinone reductase-like Zn-dependent oxidoreductase